MILSWNQWCILFVLVWAIFVPFGGSLFVEASAAKARATPSATTKTFVANIFDVNVPTQIKSIVEWRASPEVFKVNTGHSVRIRIDGKLKDFNWTILNKGDKVRVQKTTGHFSIEMDVPQKGVPFLIKLISPYGDVYSAHYRVVFISWVGHHAEKE